MCDLTRSMASFTWAMSRLGAEQMVNLASPRRAVDAFGAMARSAEEVLGTGLTGVLAQAGNLAFEVLQLGVTTVYQASGTAWQQQQGPSGWGPVPKTGRRP